jgi:hypothetical protein
LDLNCFDLISWSFCFAAIGAEDSEKIDEISDKETEVEESSEKIKVQLAPKVEEEQDLKVRSVGLGSGWVWVCCIY